MKNIRRGKDINVQWTITVDGVSQDLSSLDLSLYICNDEAGTESEMPFTTSSDKINATFYGTEQENLGVYRLTLWLNKGQTGQSVLDDSTAFRLVSRTEMEGNTDEDNLTTATVELSGNLTTGTDEEYAQLEARVTDIEDEGLILSTTIGAETISLDNSEGDAVVALPAATDTTAGLMSAAQVAELASKADAATVPNQVFYGADKVTFRRDDGGATTDLFSVFAASPTLGAGVMSVAQAEKLASAAASTSVPDGATADASAVSLQNNGTDLFTLPASSTTQAGVMTAAQATALASKADSPTLSVQSTAPATLSPTINTYTRIDSAVGTMSVTLPAIEAGTFSALSIAFTSDTTPAVTFTTADGKSIVYASDFAIDAETTYEVSALFNGVNWVLAYVTFD